MSRLQYVLPCIAGVCLVSLLVLNSTWSAPTGALQILSPNTLANGSDPTRSASAGWLPWALGTDPVESQDDNDEYGDDDSASGSEDSSGDGSDDDDGSGSDDDEDDDDGSSDSGSGDDGDDDSDSSSGSGSGLAPPAKPCFNIPLAYLLDAKVASGWTFPQLRYHLTGHCPPEMEADTKAMLEAWKKRHDEMRRGKRMMKAIMWSCSKRDVCGGHADRLKGILYSFWMAVLSRRAFFIDYPVPVELSNALKPNEFNWQLPINLRKEKWVTVNLKRKRDRAISSFKDIIKGNSAPYLRVHANLVLHRLMPDIKSVSDPKRFAMLEKLHLSVRVAMDMMFKPSDELLHRMSKFMHTSATVWEKRPVSCIHCRTGFVDTKKSKYGPNTYKKTIGAAGWLRSTATSLPGWALPSWDVEGVAAVYVASDDPSSAKAMLQVKPQVSHAKQLDFVQVPMPVFHVDKNNHNSLANFINIIAEHTLLSMCDLWVAPGSGFSETAYMWADPPMEAVAYVNMIAKQKKSAIGDPRISNHIWIHSCPQISWPDELYTTRSDIPAELAKEEPW